MLFSTLFSKCPLTGKIRGINRAAWPQWVLFWVGLAATVWYLFRVIPKPSRAVYPCIQAIQPIQIGFIVYCAALFATAFSWAKARVLLRKKQYLFASLFLCMCALSMMIFIHSDSKPGYAAPIGTGKGIFPGRVTWVYNSEAAKWAGTGTYWSAAVNFQTEYDRSFTAGIMNLSGGASNADAWDMIFRWFNNNHSRANTGYQTGDKIAIKINCNNTPTSGAGITGTNAIPQTCLAVVRSLVDAGVPQADIWIGDPSRAVTDNIFNAIHTPYPNVNVVDYYGNNGRVTTGQTTNVFSNSYGLNNSLSTCFYNARYIVALPIMKGHEGQNFSFGAKNFFGINGISWDYRQNNHPADNDWETAFITSTNVGRKVVLWCMDAYYPNRYLNGIPQTGWAESPFNGRPMSSFIVSLDGVAEESVSLDFLTSHYGLSLNGEGYIHNAANAGVGVHEHWNNATLKQYTRNLNPNANGIELVYVNANDKPTIAFSAAAANVGENSASVVLTVNRSNLTTTQVGVSYATANGTATAGADYTATNGTLTFLANETQKSISVPILDDALTEGAEAFTITLSNPTNGAILGSIPTATVTIVDDEQARYSVPGIVQAENYMLGGEAIAYHDLTAGNTGGEYRTDDVDIQACTDVGNGFNVGWTQAGEWLNYLITVTQTDNYAFICRVASGVAGTKTLQIAIDGADVGGAINFTSATGWQTWVDASSTPVLLTAGNHTMKVSFITGDINFNQVDVKSSTITVPAAPVLSAPANNAVNIPANPTLSWNSVSGAATYRVQVSGDNAFATTIIDDATLTSPAKAIGGLNPSTAYYWRVDARNIAGTSAWSTVFGFTTGSQSGPVTVSLNPTKDAYVKSGVNAAINYGTATVLEAKTQATGADVNRQIYLTFDLSSFTGTVTAANVQLDRSAGLANVAMTVHECSNVAWSETGITWDNKPAQGAAVTTVTLTAANGLYTFDVGAYVAARKAAGATAVTMVLIGAEQGGTAQQVFSSKEGASKPVLQLTYQSGTVVVPAAPVPAAPANGAANVAINPTLTWNAVSGATTYRVQVSTLNTFATTIVDDATPTQPTKAVSGLGSSTTYYWRVNAKNAAGTSAWSDVWSFITTTSTTTTITINPAKDAHVRGGTNAAVNYGNNAALEVKTQATDLTYSRNTYINFSLTGFTGTVSTASLLLYRSAGAANIVVTAYECADNAWGETTINWNNKPAVGAAVATATMTTTMGSYAFDVTAYVKARKAAGATALTFVVIGAEQGGTAQQSFNSKEGTNKPVLQVVYTGGLPKGFDPSARARKINYNLNIVGHHNSALTFTLPNPGAYRLAAYTVLGAKVQELSAGNGVAGINTVRMHLPQGLYVLYLTAEGASVQKELSIVR
jgi:hypothetical protein